MFKTLKKKKIATASIERYELKALFLRYLMRCTENLNNFSNEDYLTLSEILQERYANRSRFSSLSRNINVCSFTGRTRGYYDFTNLSRNQFKQLAGAGVLPGFRKAS
jgi:ribosomal protein S14